MKNHSRAQKVTNIAIGVATIIGGGFVIFQFSNIVPLPGMKYVLMSPYLSLMFYILIMRVESKYTLLYVGAVFGGIMIIINTFMGISILLTTLLSQGVMLPLKRKRTRAFVGSIAFSGFSTFVALNISKLLLGGAFAQIKLEWIVLSTVFALLMGTMGASFAKRITRYIMN